MKMNNAPGIFGATVGISAVVTAGFGWPEVLLGWCLCGVIRGLLPQGQRRVGRAEAWWLLLGSMVIISGVLLAAEKAFPGDGTFPFVSVGLAILMYRTLVGEGDTGELVSNILGMVLLILLGTMLLFGFGGGSVGELRPGGFRWSQVWITLGVSCPWWQIYGEWRWFLGGGILSVGMSILCRYVLGACLTEYYALPFYRAAESIRIMGTELRLGALLSGAVLLGAYNMLSLIGGHIRCWGEIAMPERKRTWWSGIVIGTGVLIEWWYLNGGLVVKKYISTVFWGFVPIYALLVVILRKMKKVLDKSGNVE